MSENVVAHAPLRPAVHLRAKPQLRGELILTAAYAFVALAILLFLLPLMLGVAAAIFVQDGGPVLFAHRRLGRLGRPFHCLKFRTMTMDAEARLSELLATDASARDEWARHHKLRNDPRVTRLGAFLRRSSLDELPQLLNVVRGEMSFVGPRPIVLAEVPRYGRRISYYYAVKPGLTGLWQVSGRNDLSYRTRVAMDCIYSQQKSPMMDLWLLMRTVPAVLVRRGSY